MRFSFTVAVVGRGGSEGAVENVQASAPSLVALSRRVQEALDEQQGRESWHVFALLGAPLSPVQQRLVKTPVTLRQGRVSTRKRGTMTYFLAHAPLGARAEIIRLGLSGEGAYLVLSREVIGPERFADAVHTALRPNNTAALAGSALLAALPDVICVGQALSKGIELFVSEHEQRALGSAFAWK